MPAELTRSSRATAMTSRIGNENGKGELQQQSKSGPGDSCSCMHVVEPLGSM